MSVINKALSELDKRKKNTTYGKYEKPELNANSNLRLWLIVVLVLMLGTLLGVTYYKFMVEDKSNANLKADISSIKDNKNSLNLVYSKKEVGADAPVSVPYTVDETKVVTSQTLSKSNDKIENKHTEIITAPQDRTKQDLSSASMVYQVSDKVKIPNQGTLKSNSLHAPDEKQQESDEIFVGNKYDSKDEDQITYVEENNESQYSDDERIAENIISEKSNSFIKVSQKKLTTQEQIDFYYKQAKQALARGDTSGAIKAYKNVLTIKNTDASARENLAGLLYGSGNILEAVRVLDQGIRLEPAHYDYRLYLARIYAKSGKNDDAIKVLKYADPPIKNNIDYYATLASIARANEDFKEAEQAYKKLTNASDREGKWYLGLAIVQEKQGQFRDALVSYKKAASLYLSKASRDFVQNRIKMLEAHSYDR